MARELYPRSFSCILNLSVFIRAPSVAKFFFAINVAPTGEHGPQCGPYKIAAMGDVRRLRGGEDLRSIQGRRGPGGGAMFALVVGDVARLAAGGALFAANPSSHGKHQQKAQQAEDQREYDPQDEFAALLQIAPAYEDRCRRVKEAHDDGHDGDRDVVGSRPRLIAISEDFPRGHRCGRDGAGQDQILQIALYLHAEWRERLVESDLVVNEFDVM